MAPYLKALLEGGDDYRIDLYEYGARLRPADKGCNALEEFRSVVAELCDNGGKDYRMGQWHINRDDDSFVDVVMIHYPID